jgi:signal peptidase II
MLYAIVTVLILILDQGLKYWTSVNITLDTGMKELIPGVLHLANVHNTGAAFGLLKDTQWARWLFVVLALILAVVVIVVLAKNIVKGGFGRWTLIPILAGALGNCIDRIISGYVVDMFELEFMTFPVFNVADIFVTVGGILFCFYIMLYKAPELSEEEKAAEEEKAQRLARQRAVAREQGVADIRAISKEKSGKVTTKSGHREERTGAARPKPMPEEPSTELDDDYDPFAEWTSGSKNQTIRTAEVQDPKEPPIYVPPASESVPEEKVEAPKRRSAAQRRERPATEPRTNRRKVAPAEPPVYKPAAAKPAAAPEKEQPTANTDDMDFSLEDILQEFKDL